MSLRAIVAVFEHSESRLGDRLVLLALADYAHDDGRNAYPAVDTLAAKARVDRRTVQRSLAALETAGEIEQTGVTPRGTKVWRITLDALGGDKLPPEGSSTRSSTRSGGTTPPPGVRTPPERAGAPPLERWGAWSNANPEVKNPETIDYVLAEFDVPEAQRAALASKHKRRRPR